MSLNDSQSDPPVDRAYGVSRSTNKVCLYLHVYEGLSDFPVNGAEETKWDRQLEEKALHKW